MMGGLGVSPVRAEGSRSLYPASYSGTNAARANLDFSNTSQRYVNRVHRYPFLYVYAQAGEYILLGSRNRTAGGVGAINVYNPQSFGVPGDETVPGSANFTCSAGTTGLIADRAAELAGPKSVTGLGGSNTYTPCVYQAPSTGVYGVVFGVSSSGAGSDGSVATPAESNNSVSAWDVTVRSSDTSTTDLNGRLFTYAFVGWAGTNGRSIYSTHYYVTRDGYRYAQDLHGLDPNGYAIYANSLGFMDNGQPLYKDVRGTGALATPLPSGVTAQIAEYPIFFSDVDPNGANNTEVSRTLGALGIPLVPPMPTVSNVRFQGSVSGSTSTTGAGGTFLFDSTNTITFRIVISRDGSDFNPNTVTNATLTGVAYTGSHTVTWNGKDNNGNDFPTGGPYLFKIEGRNGETHFPIIDAENNFYGGPKVTRLNTPGGSGAFADNTVYYDDRGYVTRGGQVIGNLNGTLCPTGTTGATGGPSPDNALTGVDSSTYPRAWGTSGTITNNNTDCLSDGWGDAKGLDLWTYFATAPQQSNLTIIPVTIDVGTSVTAPAVSAPGATVQGSFTFGNHGTGTATGLTYTLQLPAGLSGVVIGNLPTGVNYSYNSGSGQVTFTGAPTSLNPGQYWVGSNGLNLMTYSYTAPASPVPNTLPVSTAITTSDSDTYLANNTASATTYVGNNDLWTTVSVPASTAPGSNVSGTLQFGNGGETAVSSLTDGSYGVQLGSAGHRPTSITFTSLPPGVTYSYNAGTGVVTLTGMPTTLAAGQLINFAFTYTIQGTEVGPIPVTTTITTPADDANAANNQATASTSVLIPDVTTTVSPPATANPGATVAVPVSFSNSGTGTAANVSYTLTLPTGLGGVSCAGATCAYNSATGAVTISGLPTSLTAGQGANLVLSYTAPASGSVAVTSTVATSTWQGSNVAPDTATGSTSVGNGSGFDVMTAISGPATVTAASSAAVTVTFTNLGPGTASGVSYQVTVPAGVSSVSCAAPVVCSAPVANVVTVTGLPTTLSTGQSTQAVLGFTVPVSGSLTFTGTVAAAGDAVAANNTAATTLAITNSVLADVTAAISAPASVAAGSTVNVPVTFSNLGPAAATGATYTVTVPAGLGSVTCAPATCNYSGTTVTITGSGFPTSLAAGASASATLVFTAPASGPITLTAVAGTTATEANVANNSASTSIAIGALTDMTAAISGPASVVAGSTVNVPVTFSNLGPAIAASATYTVTVPAGLGTITCAPATCSYSGTTVTITGAGFPGSLGVGASASATLVFTAPASGPITLTAVAGTSTTEANVANNTASTTIAIGAPTQADLVVGITDGVSSVSSGGTTTYTITVTNNGPAAVTGATLVNPNMTGLTKVSVTCSASPGQCASAPTPAQLSGGFILPPLASGATYQILVSTSVSAASGTVTSTATVVLPGGLTDPNPANNSASDADTVSTASLGAPAPVPTLSPLMLAVLAVLMIALMARQDRGGSRPRV